MTTADRRSPLAFNRDALLLSLGAARLELVQVRSKVRPKSGLCRCVDALLDDIDELALVMTGRRDFFHSGGHAALSRESRGDPI